ncbi:hypothetical protein [Bradyrhizobium sp. BRP56]|uniref:hypothetical protein n=1 Tax=Bradyrhizobium sp. BRP56 TaxID=2793819 RepID=UPI001CD3812F|nr:hypothetical protein [Bradyrhizobium sp. BRP56]MCA1399366.1 hypothetical protein [Bradyrhizobium sp. BRP56]
MQVPVAVEDEDDVLATLPPLDRWKYLAKNNKPELIVSMLALFGGIYMLIAGSIHLGIDQWFATAAQAQERSSQTTSLTSRELFEWYVGVLMGISLLCSWGLTMFATNGTKVTFGKDTTRTIIGFVVGFLSGGAGKVK